MNALRVPLQHLPEKVQHRWVEEFKEDAATAFKALLTGSAHVCEKCGCSRPNFNAVRLFCELEGSVGPASVMVLQLVQQQLGAQSIDEAAKLVGMGRESMRLMEAGISDEEAIEESIQLLVRLLPRHPKKRDEALKRLGAVSSAEVVSENGR